MTLQNPNTAQSDDDATVGSDDGRVGVPVAAKKTPKRRRAKTTPKQLADLAAAIKAVALLPAQPANGSRTTKAGLVLGKLREPDGVTIAELIEATSWQAHSVRGFLSGTVKTKLALPLVSEIGKDGVRRYRVVGGQGASGNAAASKRVTSVAASVGAAK